MTDIRTARVYKRATGPRIKRAGHFDTDEVPREEMDACNECRGSSPEMCPIFENLHPQEVIIICDYKQ